MCSKKAMAINDTINFNSTVDYFKLYNQENATNHQPKLPSSVPSTTQFTPSTSTFSTPAATTPSTTIPFVATIPLAITSKIINNYSTSQIDDNSFSNYTNTSNSYNDSNKNNNNNGSYFTAINSFNQSTLYQYKNLTSNSSSDDNNNFNDSAKISYESGSNFMLLLEDFGEYFYNYNGSDYNSSISIYQANCSLTNSSLCSEANARKLNFKT